MRNMSFMLTTEQIVNRSKTVTRRVGWTDLKAGTVLRAVRKGMGLKKAEKVEELAIIRVVDVRRESLMRLIIDPDYGSDECRREGFPDMDPSNFTRMFRRTQGLIGNLAAEVTRIEFEYV